MNNGMTKKQSAMLQGIAILLMLHHHFFTVPSTDHVFFLNVEAVRLTAWFGKICVGLFAFVSGYGIYHSFQKHHRKTFFTTLFTEYKASLFHILKIFIKFWIVLILFVLIETFLLHKPFDAAQFWQNFFAIHVSYNGSWWYLQQYLQFMLLAPLMDCFFHTFSNKRETLIKWGFFGVLLILSMSLVLLGFLQNPSLLTWLLSLPSKLQISFTLVFGVGYLMARFQLYEKLLITKYTQSHILVFLTGLICFIGSIAVRVTLATDPSYAKHDFLIVPVFIYGFLLLEPYLQKIGCILAFLGKHSTYMWLVHCIICGYLNPILALFYIPGALYYIVQVIGSLATSMLLLWAEKNCCRILSRIQQQKK